jgi:hypothetical protein
MYPLYTIPNSPLPKKSINAVDVKVEKTEN